MDVMFIDAKYKENISLDEDTLNYCKKYKTIALYTSIQFIPHLNNITKQLEDAKIKVITSQPSRTNKPSQILGCDSEYKDLNLTEEPDAFLYIGDGKFHPQALALAQKDMKDFKEIISYNPITKSHTILTSDSIQKILKKYKGSLIKFLSSDIIGVLITTKPGQQQLKPSKLLKEKYPNKQFYYFVENTINFRTLEDFPFIQSWVNSACPRIGFEDNAEIPTSLININDAYNSKEILSKESWLTKA